MATKAIVIGSGPSGAAEQSARVVSVRKKKKVSKKKVKARKR